MEHMDLSVVGVTNESDGWKQRVVNADDKNSR